jgi:hypothetical protein
MLFTDIIHVYTENHTKHVRKNAHLMIFTVVGTCIYNWALKGQCCNRPFRGMN